MTAKEKAFELILKIEKELIDNRVYRGTIKKLALIAVDELIKEHEGTADFLWSEIGYLVAPPVFWEEVKHEINNFK